MHNALQAGQNGILHLLAMQVRMDSQGPKENTDNLPEMQIALLEQAEDEDTYSENGEGQEHQALA